MEYGMSFRIPIAIDMKRNHDLKWNAIMMLNQTGDVNDVYFWNNKYNHPEENVM